jgi:UDP-3-O-acyl-N-acetylglucosamine deacetylase
VERLLSAGLARGAGPENALIVYEDRFSDSLRVPQECARHKLLDLIGDLSLIGLRIRAHIIAVKPSHLANTQLARLLLERAQRVGQS